MWLILCHPPDLLQVRVLVHTDVTKYLEFKGVDGSFVLNKGRVEKVPATDYEALRSPLLGLFEKRRLRSFLLCVTSPPAKTESCPGYIDTLLGLQLRSRRLLSCLCRHLICVLPMR